MTKPWERQKGETHTSFKKFLVYLETERPITLKEFCERTNQNYKSVHRIFYKYNWADRARQYDNEMFAAEVEAIKRKRAKEAEERDERHRKIAQLGQKRSANILASTPDDDIRFSDAIRLMETSIRLEREIAGEFTEKHKHELDVPNEIKIRIVTREDIENERKKFPIR